jgi:hypothetical protein
LEQETPDESYFEQYCEFLRLDAVQSLEHNDAP